MHSIVLYVVRGVFLLYVYYSTVIHKASCSILKTPLLSKSKAKRNASNTKRSTITTKAAKKKKNRG